MIVGNDGPVLIVDARSAFILRDAMRKWYAEHQRQGARQKTTAVKPLLEEWERVADAYARTLTVRTCNEAPAVTVERMTTAHVATELHCTERHVRRLIAKGDLTAQRSGRDWLIDPGDVQALLDLRRSA